MKYQASCNSCAYSGTLNLPAKDYASFKAEGLSCTSCVNGRLFPIFNPENVRIAYKGDAWADKNLREKEYRNQRSQMLGVKQKESHFVPTLQPNYNGMEVDTWRDAQHLAATEGKDAASYQPLVSNEVKKP